MSEMVHPLIRKLLIVLLFVAGFVLVAFLLAASGLGAFMGAG